MKRLMYISTLSLAATLLLATAAAAQGVPPGGGTAAYGCPEDAPFPATVAGDPGEASLRCFATEQEAEEYSATGGTASPEPSASPEPAASPEASASPESSSSPEASASPEATSVPPEESESLPDTGGPGIAAFLLPAAGLLAVAGLVGLRAVRRRQ